MSSPRRPGVSIDGANVPGNPLRSYRMSMLAHGFVDRQHHEDFTLDESDPMSYSVVRLHAGRASLASIGAVVLVLAVAAAVLLLV